MTAISILVVDDEPDVVDLFERRFRRELRKGQYLLRYADSGEAALSLLDAGTDPEVMLILSDINMPGISGFELLTETRRRWPGLPVAMITAYGDQTSYDRAMAGGASDFITKPIDFDLLREKIRALTS